MNISLVGYGRMGKEVGDAAELRRHNISARIDPETGDHEGLTADVLEATEGIIEFAWPENILERVSLAAEYKIPYVIGTTGWNNQEQALRAIAGERNASILFGSNFSIGANIFFRIVEEAAGLINAFSDYDIMMMEIHHKKKSDSPSGTALSIAERIIQCNLRKQHICTETLQRPITETELSLGSIRGGNVPGIHRVMLDSHADSIVLEHSARNRSGFALGAVLALEWLKGRVGCYTVDDFFSDFMQD